MLTIYQAWFRISETLVSQSKWEISAEDACRKIREILNQTEKPEKKVRYRNIKKAVGLGLSERDTILTN